MALTRRSGNSLATVQWIGSRQCLQPPASTAGWSFGATSGHSGSTSSPSDARRHSRRRDGTPELGIPATEPCRPCLWWSPSLVDQQHRANAEPGKTQECRQGQTVAGMDLSEGNITRSIVRRSTHRRAIRIPRIIAYRPLNKSGIPEHATTRVRRPRTGE